MAYIRRRGQFWRAEVVRRGVRTSRTFDEKAAAEEWAAGIESEIRRDRYLERAEAERLTLREALQRYDREVTEQKRGSSRERSRIRKWLRHDLASKSLGAIKTSDLASYRDARLAEGAAPKTVREELQLIRHVFVVASTDWGFTVDNPVAKEKLRMPPPSRERDRRLSDLEYAHLLGAACVANAHARLPIAEIIVLAIETAMRRGEIADMRWEHVDLDGRSIHLPNTKNGYARTIPLSAAAVGALELIDPQDVGPVFPTSITPDGTPVGVTADGITQAFERVRDAARARYLSACEQAGITPQHGFLHDLRLHDLRHEATSRLARIFSPQELARVTGHRTLQMMMRYYHPTAGELADRMRERAGQ